MIDSAIRTEPDDISTAPVAGDLVPRHRLATRLWHWVNVVALAVMLMSGLMIFNAHPRLYWGQYGANPDHAVARDRLARRSGLCPARRDRGAHHRCARRVARQRRRDASTAPSRTGSPFRRATASPTRASGIWPLPGCWRSALLAFMIVVAASIAISSATCTISRDEIAPSHLWQDIKDHARLRFPTGAAALRYNILQKLSYGGGALRAAAADHPDRPDHVAGDGFGLVRSCSTSSAGVSRRARSTSSPPGRWSASSSSISRWWCWPGRSTKCAR